MSIITLPKVATEEIAFGSQICRKTKDGAAFISLQGGLQHRSHNVPKWQCCFRTEKHHNHLSAFHFFPPPC